uniref:Uncharacterized protein n=1 Tax=Physcomitrium patens TaxID=3218 RepID=A0A2K1IZY6_PHYPA|nr:hypothetical protein PHYPA_022745 [Physcomitrium patens]
MHPAARQISSTSRVPFPVLGDDQQSQLQLFYGRSGWMVIISESANACNTHQLGSAMVQSLCRHLYSLCRRILHQIPSSTLIPTTNINESL